jgi:hypothetical protein
MNSLDLDKFIESIPDNEWERFIFKKKINSFLPLIGSDVFYLYTPDEQQEDTK